MVFSSAIFLFVFLPIVCALYFIVPGIKGKNTLLIIASLIFYAFGEPIYILLMIGSIIANYIFGLMEGRFSKANNIAGKKIVLIIAVICNIGVLCVFKYTAFILENINYAGRLNIKIPGIALPIGISFFTFQALSYVIDVYRNPEMVQKNLFNLMLYVSFFPQLIAGPIIRYNEIAKQINNRTSSIEKTTEGISRFIRGLTKKLIIANATGYMADSIFALKITDYNFLVAWVGAIAYTLQIYYDFSGYSDMAIGMAKIFGFEFNENFNHPYSAKGIKDFWRRWHISLSLWFREYVYIPLGGNRKGKFRCEFNKMIVFLLTGIWHGANWTFVIWGLIHGVANVIEDTLGSIIKIKNNIIKRALDANGESALDEDLEGPVALVIGNEDYLEPSKVIYNFTKDHDFYKIKGGVIEGKVMTAEEIITLAKLPSRQELLAKLAGALLGNITKLAVALDQVKDQKANA